MQPATTATDPESQLLTVLTQKPPFSTGNNLCLLTSAATFEAALQEARSENGNRPNGIDNSVLAVSASLDIATGSVCGRCPNAFLPWKLP
jgi:hypothetical protein